MCGAVPAELHHNQSVKEASQSLPTVVGKKSQIIFCRGVYLAENTSQAASVRIVRHRRTRRARGGLQKFGEKPHLGFSAKLCVGQFRRNCPTIAMERQRRTAAFCVILSMESDAGLSRENRWSIRRYFRGISFLYQQAQV